MVNVLKVLIVEDHPLVAEAYQDVLRSVEEKNKGIYFDVCVASNCKSAYEIISNKPGSLDMVFLDMNIPASRDQGLITCHDLAKQITKHSVMTKVIVIASANDNYLLSNIVKSVNPIAFLVKNETTKETLMATIESVVKGYPFYSVSVLKLIKNRFVSSVTIDDIDQQMLYELSLGTKMKELPGILPLSMAGLERRKRQLKKIFNIDTENDRGLLKAAREYGYL